MKMKKCDDFWCPLPLTFTPTLTTLQNCPRQRQWSAEWRFPNRWISAASGAKSQTMAERTDGKNNKIFNFRTGENPWFYGLFKRSKQPTLQKISSAAPSTTRTTLRVYFRPVFFPEICSKIRWRENRRDGKKYSILRFSVLRNIKENQGDEIPSFCRNFESCPLWPLRYVSMYVNSENRD